VTARAPDPKDSTKADSAKGKGASPKKPDDKKAEKDTALVDLTVELVDASNVTARLPLSRFGVARRPLETHILRRADREKQQFTNPFEIVLQTYVMPMSEFTKVSPQFAPDRLRSIRLVFDRIAAATVIVDDIGVSTVDPAFFTVARE